jgi:uncharacterized damage-inducible protein DinB
MAIKDALLPEYDHEMATTRKVLERAPLSEISWRPHNKSMTVGELAAHIADIPGWAGTIINDSAFDVAAAGQYKRPVYASTSELLSAFDANVAKARASIEAKSDAEMMSPWSLKEGDKVHFTLPKASVIRSMLLNHLIHHRGQFSVYLRLKEVPVPAIYGPSADER